MAEIDIGSLVRIAGEESRALYIVDGVVGCDFRLLDKAGGWSLMDRSSVVLADDQDVTAPSDSPDDQFTGEDMGAQMAAAEGGEVECQDCNRLKQVINDDDGELNYEVGVCTWTTQFRARNFPRICAEFEPLPRSFLRTEGYRVGDAHEGGEV